MVPLCPFLQSSVASRLYECVTLNIFGLLRHQAKASGRQKDPLISGKIGSSAREGSWYGSTVRIGKLVSVLNCKGGLGIHIGS